MKKLSTYLLVVGLLVFGISVGLTFAQDVDSESPQAEPEKQPQEVLKIEEVIIEIPAMKVEEDLMPIKIDDYEKILAKERK